MIVLDSNIVIYSAQPNYAYLRPLVSNPQNHVSYFTMLEVLGFHTLLPIDKLYFESVFSVLKLQEISKYVLEQAISLRQNRKMSAGDAIIAATAIVTDSILYTRNVSDFNWINGLHVFNPIP